MGRLVAGDKFVSLVKVASGARLGIRARFPLGIVNTLAATRLGVNSFASIDVCSLGRDLSVTGYRLVSLWVSHPSRTHYTLVGAFVCLWGVRVVQELGLHSDWMSAFL